MVAISRASLSRFKGARFTMTTLIRPLQSRLQKHVLRCRIGSKHTSLAAEWEEKRQLVRVIIREELGGARRAVTPAGKPLAERRGGPGGGEAGGGHAGGGGLSSELQQIKTSIR